MALGQESQDHLDMSLEPKLDANLPVVHVHNKPARLSGSWQRGSRGYAFYIKLVVFSILGIIGVIRVLSRWNRALVRGVSHHTDTSSEPLDSLTFDFDWFSVRG